LELADLVHAVKRAIGGRGSGIGHSGSAPTAGQPPASSRRPRAASVVLALLLAAPLPLAAEEGGSGHYLPGSMASFMDGVSPTETFLVRYNFLWYDGSVSASRALPIAGLSAIGADAKSTAHGLTFFWRPPIELSERWSFGVSATIPYVNLDVSADVAVPLEGGGTVNARRSSTVSGIGDIVLMPVMLNYNVSPDVNWNFRLGIYAPTGSYEVGRLANTSKNFWTLEPAVAFMYFGQKNGRELSMFFGMDFSTENSDTDYKSGTQAHLEFTAAQHFPLAGGLAGAGLTGYWYEQVSGDSGSGATFGDFEARTIGLGPALSYVWKADGHDMLTELKWLHELDTKKRLEGDTIVLKVIYKFY
jgi:hypothetical protein